METAAELTLEEIQERKRRSEMYKQRLANADKAPGYLNCAGLVKYLLGISEKDGFVKTGDASKNGLIHYLRQVDILEIDEFNEQTWAEKSQNADAVAFLHRDENDRWNYLHFLVPNPDPKKPFEIFHRNGFAEVDAEIGDMREVMTYKSLTENSRLIFFRVK